jgi:hypothetical protein
MRWPGDLPKGRDERFTNMKWVARKVENLPKEVHLLADRPPTKGFHSTLALLPEAYVTDLVQVKILVAIRTIGGSQEITNAEYTEEDRRIRY